MKEIRLHLTQISNIGPLIQSQNFNPYNKDLQWLVT